MLKFLEPSEKCREVWLVVVVSLWRRISTDKKKFLHWFMTPVHISIFHYVFGIYVASFGSRIRAHNLLKGMMQMACSNNYTWGIWVSYIHRTDASSRFDRLVSLISNTYIIRNYSRKRSGSFNKHDAFLILGHKVRLPFWDLIWLLRRPWAG